LLPLLLLLLLWLLLLLLLRLLLRLVLLLLRLLGTRRWLGRLLLLGKALLSLPERQPSGLGNWLRKAAITALIHLQGHHARLLLLRRRLLQALGRPNAGHRHGLRLLRQVRAPW